MDPQTPLDTFYDLSTQLTGFSQVHLYGTGQGETYYNELQKVLGSSFVNELLDAFRHALHRAEKHKLDLKTVLRQDLLSNPKWGPVCRNLIKMWYLGSWYALSDDWQSTYVQSNKDVDHVISPQSFIEGLVWKAMRVHPKSAKQPGYGTWAFPPR